MEVILNKNKKAYKAFNVDSQNRLYCKNKYYIIGEEATQDGRLDICSNGIHFCWELNDINEFYSLLGENVVIGEIEVLGDIVNNGDMKKSCTNKMKLIRLLTNEEVLKISNSGSRNSGIINSGDYNSGRYNSGDFNSGDCNSGNCNSGDCNSGNCNSGDCNSGNYNSGDFNSGDYNSGDCNSGDFNSGRYNSGSCNSGSWTFGCFNTESSKMNLFNKPSGMTQSDWFNSKYYSAIVNMRHTPTEWINYTDEQKASDKAKELIGGYLKTYSDKEAYRIWWDKLSNEDRANVLDIPNFDKDIFLEITGIDVELSN